MNGGSFNLTRKLWENTVLANDPFSEREAWVWMIAHAAWKPHVRDVGRLNIRLERGQLAGSVRFFAERWRWGKSSVQRFFDKLRKAEMIRTETGTGLLVITLCNYDQYQNGATAPGTVAGQSRDTSGTNKKTGKDLEEESANALSAREPVPADDVAAALGAYHAAAERAGWPKVQKLTTARRGALKGRLRDAGGLDGWTAALNRAEASDFLCARAPSARGSPFRADFDFLTRESSFTKLMEGSYDNRGRPEPYPPQPPGRRNGAVAAFLDAARNPRGSGVAGGADRDAPEALLRARRG